MKPLRYPESRATNDVEVAGGITFPDPYQWLEAETDEVRRWQAAQNELTDQYVTSWPHFPKLKENVTRYLVDRPATLPRFVAGCWFRSLQGSDTRVPQVLIADEPYGEGRAIPIPVVPPSNPFISWVCPSPNGELIAVGLCFDGSEKNSICLIDRATGAEVKSAPPQRLMDAWMGGVCWLPDSSGFYFLALDESSAVFRQTIIFHDLSTGSQRREDVPLSDPQSSDYTLITSSVDGRYLLASHGLFAPRPIAIKRLGEKHSDWKPFITQLDGTVAGFVLKDRLIAVTDVGAPRGRVVAISLDSEDPNDPQYWSELLPESDIVVRSIRLIGDFMYVTAFAETYSQVKVLRTDGSLVQDVALPGKGAVVEPLFPLMTLVSSGHPSQYLFVFSSLIQSWGVYRHQPGKMGIETVREPEVHLSNAVVSDHWAVSSDGTKVPYHTVRLADVEPHLPRPALLYAYGAFNVPLLPEYPGAMVAFVMAGGIFVHGHIRGGAELGSNWWRAGRMQNKQNCYRDLYAIAEDLAAKRLCKRDMLAMTGRSNGGLMAGVALAQRPDLWRVIVAQVPITDVIGMPRDPYGRFALASEYGDPGDPDEVARMAAFSPYHLVKDGLRYPSIYIDAGGTDPRCPPWHARKFAARLQAANPRETVALLRIRDNAGHGFATAKSIQIESYSGWLAFILRQLNMHPICHLGVLGSVAKSNAP